MIKDLFADIQWFLMNPVSGVGTIWNEHGLQLELGIHLRGLGYVVEFERPFKLEVKASSTKTSKRELDVLVFHNGTRTAIELKTPLAGRVPETMYDFCADLEFVERLIDSKFADQGFCLLVTNNRQFWHAPLKSTGIYSFFRDGDTFITGSISKPTGARDSNIFLERTYNLSSSWKDLGNTKLMDSGRFLLVPVTF